MSIVIERSDRERRGYRLTAELLLAEPREQVFEFFADAYQLEAMTPPWLNFTVQTPRPIAMQDGTLIDYSLRVYGLPIRWQSRISHWQPPQQFVDEQVKGPYRRWHHLHAFEEVEGGTLVRDVVDYAVPLSFLVHPFVRRDLIRIFNFRRETMSQVFTPVAD